MTEEPTASRNPRYDDPTLDGARYRPSVAGVERVRPRSGLHIISKAGRAYGFYTENAWIEDPATGRAFALTATVYADDDGVIGDDRYRYDELARPILAALGEQLTRQLLRNVVTPRNVTYRARPRSDRMMTISKAWRGGWMATLTGALLACSGGSQDSARRAPATTPAPVASGSATTGSAAAGSAAVAPTPTPPPAPDAAPAPPPDPLAPLPADHAAALAAIPADPAPEALIRDTHYWVGNEKSLAVWHARRGRTRRWLPRRRYRPELPARGLAAGQPHRRGRLRPGA
jgi:hypothetical protein